MQQRVKNIPRNYAQLPHSSQEFNASKREAHAVLSENDKLKQISSLAQSSSLCIHIYHIVYELRVARREL